MANGQFAKLAERFVVATADTKNGRSEFAKEYSLARNSSFLLVLDSDAKELAKSRSRVFEFDQPLIKKIEEIGAEYRISQTVLVDYLLTWIDSENIHDSKIGTLISELNSPQFATRNSAERKLEALGEPAYQFLTNYKPADVESRSRTRSILQKLKTRREIIVRDDLDHNIEYLVKHASGNSRLMEYLNRILPENVPFGEIERWWKENGEKHKWHASEKKFVEQTEDPTQQDDAPAADPETSNSSRFHFRYDPTLRSNVRGISLREIAHSRSEWPREILRRKSQTTL